MVIIKTEEEISLMRESGRIVGLVLSALNEKAKPGITTLELNDLAEALIINAKAIPAFKGYNGFPYVICSSKNHEIVHGFPSNEPLKAGDVISLDIGVKKNGYCGDAAFTKIIGVKCKSNVKKLINSTKECLQKGIQKAIPGNRLGDISHAIEKHALSNGFNVVRSYGGHGIGRTIHEEPHIQNYGRRGEGLLLKPGMTFAIEPMLCSGTNETELLPDGWTVITKDKKLSAHFEHTIVIMEHGPEILTIG